MRKIFFAALLLVAAFAAAAQALPKAAQALPQKVIAIEGVTEYRLPNGLRVLLLPDPAAETVTVQIVYLVGSRHEGYGEKGMAHLLEHLLFKGTKRYPGTMAALDNRGARWNATTSNDRTTYFETLSASDANLDWAIGLEADRMLNSPVSRAALDGEMTVVRNEFESGENNPRSVLLQRMQQAAFAWHNYGNPTIGVRSDIERVPVDRLRAFYRTWYQPDNAVLILGGRFAEARALALVAKHFGPLPRPKRALPQLYTQEPTQDGERIVTLRRAGESQMVSALYRVPAASHPDYPAVEILVNVLGDTPAGRLHRALVQKGLASSSWGADRALHDPGFVFFGALLDKSQDAGVALAAVLATVEGAAKEPIRADEVERARTALLNDFDKAQLETGAMVRSLAEFSALGDWRLFYLYRDRLRQTTLADVQRVAEAYLLPANRVTGVFTPTDAPQRAEIPPTPDLQAALAGYRGGEALSAGEAFEATPQNIEARVVRRTLANGIRVALLPKRTRGGNVVASLNLHWGDEQRLTNRETACSFASGLLLRGTLKHSRAELKDAFEKLNASYSVGGQGASVEVKRENLVATLRLVAEVLREPSFPPSEFEEMKRAALTGAEEARSEPGAQASNRLARHLQGYPSGHPNYTPSIDERIEWLRRATLDDAVACYRDLFGATGADFVAVGDFDVEELARLVEELFGGWRNPHPFARVPDRYFERAALENEVLTPDKANAALRAGLDLPMRDDHPDFAAMVLANYLLGGSTNARLPARVREKEGLSYSTGSSFNPSWFDEFATFRVFAIFAPQNRARVEQAVREEIERAVRQGFTPAEVEAGKKAYIELRRHGRTQDRALAGRLSSYLFAGRTFAWDTDFEARLAALDAAQVSAALKRHVDPARLSLVVAGDFKRPAAAPSAGRESPPAAAPGAGAARPAAARPAAGSD